MFRTCQSRWIEGINVHGDELFGEGFLPQFGARRGIPDHDRMRGMDGHQVFLTLIKVVHPHHI